MADLHVATVANVKSWPRTVTGGYKKRIVTVTFDGTGEYKTGGVVLTPAMLGMTTVLYLASIDKTSGTTGYVPLYDHANAKLLVYFSDSDGADGPLIVYTNTGTALRNKVWRFFVIGY